MSKDAVESHEISRPMIIGTGLVALDIVFGPEAEQSIGSWAGGTCGNVLTILSCLGWASYPVARLADDEQSQVLRQDLSSWGVHLDYVYGSAYGSTPIILQYIRRNDRGEIVHKFSFKCPVCGRHLPTFRPVPRRDLGLVLPERHRRRFSSSIGAHAALLTWLQRSGTAVRLLCLSHPAMAIPRCSRKRQP